MQYNNCKLILIIVHTMCYSGDWVENIWPYSNFIVTLLLHSTLLWAQSIFKLVQLKWLELKSGGVVLNDVLHILQTLWC